VHYYKRHKVCVCVCVCAREISRQALLRHNYGLLVPFNWCRYLCAIVANVLSVVCIICHCIALCYFPTSRCPGQVILVIRYIPPYLTGVVVDVISPLTYYQHYACQYIRLYYSFGIFMIWVTELCVIDGIVK
jgi:hypothetical protein